MLGDAINRVRVDLVLLLELISVAFITQTKKRSQEKKETTEFVKLNTWV